MPDSSPDTVISSDTIIDNGSAVDDTVVDYAERSGSDSERPSESDTIYGYPTEGPTTAKFGADNSVGGERLRKDGKPDGRSTRGRRKNEASGAKSLRLKLDDCVYGLHAMVAGLTGIDVLEIDKDEAKMLADAIHDVGEYHNITFDPKKAAYFNLCVAMGTVYGTRLVALRNRIKTEKEARQKQAREAPTPINRNAPTQGTRTDIDQRYMAPSDIFTNTSAAL